MDINKALEDLRTHAASMGFNQEEVKNIVDDIDKAVTNTNTEEVKQAFAEAQLEDGTMIQVEPEVAVGAVAAIEDPEQGFIPIPEGSYTLADGRVMVVEAGGVVAELSEVAEEEEAEMDTESKEAPAMTGDEIKKIIESVTTVFNEKFEALEKDNADLKKEMDDLQISFTVNNEKAAELNGKFISTVEALADQPVKEPTQKKRSNPFLDKSRVNELANIERFSKFNKNKK